ncbi:MAG: DUF3857 domain-containing protein [Vicingaceae bacterium]|nr:DUF3857 domain-containing protein [Vicingaceae bacterium]
MKNLFLLVLLLTLTNLYAQKTPLYTSYDWSEDISKITTYRDSLPNEEMIYLKSLSSFEYAYKNTEKMPLTQYILIHKSILLRSDNSIEENNKVYISFNENTTILKTKARVISPSNKIIELDSSKILTAVDENTNTTYKYFAFEGIEKGSIVEYFYVVEKKPYYEGSYITYQEDNAIYNYTFQLISPKNLIFKFKTINTTDTIIKDTLENGKWNHLLTKTYVPSLKWESNSGYKTKLQAFIFKLDQNTYTGANDISSYSELVQNLYNFIYNDLDKNKKLIANFLKQTNLKKASNVEDKISIIEDFIKKNIVLSSNNAAEGHYDLNFIINNKIANDYGILKLYCQALAFYDINIEIVMTCNRFDKKFDEIFEASTFLEDYLIYFPSEKKYLSPTNLASRFGVPTYIHTHNFGLFIKEVSLNGFKTAIANIKFIDAIPYNETANKMYINITFDENNVLNQNINIKQELSSYYAKDIQPFYYLITDENRENLHKELFTNINSELEPKNIKVTNHNSSDLGKKPFTIEADFETDVFIEKAGNKIIFEVGNLIGPQVQIYDSVERTLPLELEFGRYYYRSITINLPKGYNLINPEDININNVFIEDGDTTMAFVSNYTIKNNTLTILSEEYYKNIDIPVEHYQEYRKIINSAADFNKIKLIFEPN